VTEQYGEGTDTIQASVSFTLSSQVENLTLTGTGDIYATGNGLSNVLTGNSGDNILDGGVAGWDTMAGGAGNDSYFVDNTGDVLVKMLMRVLTPSGPPFPTPSGTTLRTLR
jgi:Ca2+-binding RTX toxin-like protein